MNAQSTKKTVAEFAKNLESTGDRLNSGEFRYQAMGIDRPSLRQLATDEDGAAYTISYVMVIPVLMWLFCMIIECAIIFNTKLGTVYAAYAAAPRTASVWFPATNAENATAKAQLAGVKAMTPFASGMRPGTPVTPSNEAIAYLNAYHAYSKKTVKDDYVLKKFNYAQQHVKVEVEGPPVSALDNVKVTLTYEYPFIIPGVGRLLGKQGADKKYYYPISTTVEVPNKAPQEGRKTIGIGYGTLE